MKKFYSCFFFLLPTATCFSQNLVPNPSFEDYTTCPNGQCQIIYATGWDSYSYSPDYFNACASTFSVPNNPWGYQFAATGNAYSAFYIGREDNVREYIGIALTTPLTIGSKYQVKIKVTPSELLSNGYFCNNIGVLFSMNSYAMGTICTHTPIFLPTNYAHIYSTAIISDTINWTTISGTFTADLAYPYIIIGNFFDTTNTQYLSFGSNGFGAVYFVDDVEVFLDSVSDTTYISENSLSENFFVTPNPAKNYISVKNNQHLSNLSVYDIYGRKIKEHYFVKSEGQIDVSELSNGIYLIQISTQNNIVNQKLIITH